MYECTVIDNFQTSSKSSENLSSDVRMMSVTKRMTLVSVGFALQWQEMKALISANNVTSPWVSTSVFHTFIDFHSRWTAEEYVCVFVMLKLNHSERLCITYSSRTIDWVSDVMLRIPFFGHERTSNQYPWKHTGTPEAYASAAFLAGFWEGTSQLKRFLRNRLLFV